MKQFLHLLAVNFSYTCHTVDWDIDILPNIRNRTCKSKNQIFIILLVLLLSVQRVVGPSPRHRAWATQKYRSGGEPLAAVSNLTGSRIKSKIYHAKKNLQSLISFWMKTLCSWLLFGVPQTYPEMILCFSQVMKKALIEWNGFSWKVERRQWRMGCKRNQLLARVLVEFWIKCLIKYRLVRVVVNDIAIGGRGLGFNYRASQIGHSVANSLLPQRRCVGAALPGAKPPRWAPPPVICTLRRNTASIPKGAFTDTRCTTRGTRWATKIIM